MTKKESLLPGFGLWSKPAIKRFRSGLETLFEDFFSRDWGALSFEAMQPDVTFPKINVSETEDEYNVEIAVAGFSKGDVELDLRNNDLLISADKKERDEITDEKYLSREISYRSFKRLVRFPCSVNSEKMEAKYTDGIIHFKIEKDKDKSDEDCKISIDVK